MNSTVTARAVLGILERQRETAGRLIQALTREFAALSGNDLQELETSLAAKQELMKQLEELSRDLLAMADRPASGKKNAVAEFLRRLDPQETWGLAAAWRELEGLLSQCRQKNGTNGKIISLSHRHVQQALEILRYDGQSSQSCYSRSGASQSPTPSRILGKV